MTVTDFGNTTPDPIQIETHMQAMGLQHDYQQPLRVAILGTRCPTQYGRHMASDLAQDLTNEGWEVLTRLGDGIGEAAASAARVMGGNPVTVSTIPRTLDQLAAVQVDQVVDPDRLIAVHADLRTPGWSRIGMTNAVIAHLVDAVIVVETDDLRLHEATVKEANRIWCPVYAVPGPVTSGPSTGCHDLIRTGKAFLATSADQIRPTLLQEAERDALRAVELLMS